MENLRISSSLLAEPAASSDVSAEQLWPPRVLMQRVQYARVKVDGDRTLRATPGIATPDRATAARATAARATAARATADNGLTGSRWWDAGSARYPSALAATRLADPMVRATPSQGLTYELRQRVRDVPAVDAGSTYDAYNANFDATERTRPASSVRSKRRWASGLGGTSGVLMAAGILMFVFDL